MAVQDVDLLLCPIDPEDRDQSAAVSTLCKSLADDDPWHRLGLSAERLVRSILQTRSDCSTFVIQFQGQPVGLLKLRSPWLFGVYVELIGVTHAHRGQGIGRAALRHVERMAIDQELSNVWLCASAFNERARTFYTQMGFQLVGELKDLIVTGEDEMLMRKCLG